MLYSEKLADFVINTKYEDIPTNVITRAKELMLDTVGVAIAGSTNDAILKSIKAFKDENANVSIWGSDFKATPINAAMLNAMSSHVLDFDDTLTKAILHASAILTPLCLSYGFSKTNDGKKILKAFIMGWEVAGRIGIASNGTFHKKGFHTSAIAGVFAATTAACIINDLDSLQTINALGFAASFAGGINEFLSNGSNSKILHIANAVLNGIRASKYAQIGLFAPVSIFEGRDNIFRAFGIENECNKEQLDENLSKDYMIMQVSIKPYPSCHFAHGLIDCAKLLKEDGIKACDIEEIICYVNSVPISFICEPIEQKHNPKSDYEVKFSFAYLFSLMFIDGYLNLKSFENIKRKEIADFAKKIKYEKYESTYFPKYFYGKISVKLKNQKTLIKEVKINKGNPENPLNKDELLEKFYSNVNNLALSNSIKEQILNIENIKNFKTPNK